MSWRPFDGYQPSTGLPYQLTARVSAVASLIRNNGVINAETCTEARVSPMTLCRYRDRLLAQGTLSPSRHTGGPQTLLSADDSYFLALWTMMFPTVSGAEAAAALRMHRGIAVSESTVYREWDRLHMPRKILRLLSAARSEPSRIAWWTNPPNLGLAKHQRGVRGVNHVSMICIDEALYYIDKSNRKYGRAFKGERPTETGQSRLGGQNIRVHVITAVDQLVGTIQTLVWIGASPNRAIYDLFVLSVTQHPSCGRNRFFMMDNASWHSEASMANILLPLGHRYGFRPTHSPDFAPSEWAHAYSETSLKRNTRAITPQNYAQHIQAAYDAIGGGLGRSFFSNAHYAAPGYAPNPYRGQQVAH